jgi:mono/diheme cytochrome c family protein
MGWHGQFQRLLGWTMLAFLVVGIGGLGTSFMVPRWALLIPSFMGIWLLGHFERAREFMRKPWVIGEYMYSNGVHKEELSFLQSEGLLKHATYVKHREITEVNKVECGKDVFMLACSRCHSTTGLNSVLDKFTAMYGGDKPWDAAGMRLFIKGMHQTRTYMPPFPGNDKEAEALVAYILQLREKPETLHGAQTEGIVIAPVPSGPAMTAQTNSTH